MTKVNWRALSVEQWAGWDPPSGEPSRAPIPDSTVPPAVIEAASMAQLLEARDSLLEDIFPRLGELVHEAIQEDDLDRRSFNILRRAGCATWSDLANLTVDDLWSAPNAGRLTVERILTAAAAVTKSYQLSEYESPRRSQGRATDADRGFSPEPPDRIEFDRLLFDLGLWAGTQRDATSVADLLSALGGPLPEDIAAAFQEIGELTIHDVLPALNRFDSSQLIVDFLHGLGPGSSVFLVRHVASPWDRRPSYQALRVGVWGGVTFGP